MEPDTLHDLTAAYALDALDAAEEREYEAHLTLCARCRADLAELSHPAAMLAYGVDAPPPPPALRERILESARAERTNVTPLRPRFVGATRTVAAVAACAAVGFGLWSLSLSRDLDRERTSLRAFEVFADPATRQIALSDDRGALYVTPTGEATLVARLGSAPAGKTYVAWVVEGGTPRAAGAFDPGGDPALVPLDERVPAGATVAVTIEDDAGATVPRGPRVLTAGT